MALEQRVLNDHFSTKASPRLTARFRRHAEQHFDVTTEEQRERRYLAELEEALLATGILQRLLTMGKRRRRNVGHLLLSLLVNEHEMTPRFRTEIEEVMSERRECRTPKSEDETSRALSDEIQEMRSVDDEQPRQRWQSVLAPRDISLFS